MHLGKQGESLPELLMVEENTEPYIAARDNDFPQQAEEPTSECVVGVVFADSVSQASKPRKWNAKTLLVAVLAVAVSIVGIGIAIQRAEIRRLNSSNQALENDNDEINRQNESYIRGNAELQNMINTLKAGKYVKELKRMISELEDEIDSMRESHVKYSEMLDGVIARSDLVVVVNTKARYYHYVTCKDGFIDFVYREGCPNIPANYFEDYVYYNSVFAQYLGLLPCPYCIKEK